jgi:hypothetical protein
MEVNWLKCNQLLFSFFRSKNTHLIQMPMHVVKILFGYSPMNRIPGIRWEKLYSHKFVSLFVSWTCIHCFVFLVYSCIFPQLHLNHYCGLNHCILLNFYVEILTPKVMVSGDEWVMGVCYSLYFNVPQRPLC